MEGVFVLLCCRAEDICKLIERKIIPLRSMREVASFLAMTRVYRWSICTTVPEARSGQGQPGIGAVILLR
jgi:hypothetical protein